MNKTMWMGRASILWVFAGGCPDDSASVGDDSSSTGDTTAGGDPSTGAESSGSADSSAGIDPDTSGSSSGETTTGGAATGRARVIVPERTGQDLWQHPVVREYAEGVVSAPVPIVPDLPDDVGVSLGDVEPAGAHFAYCVRGEQVDDACFVRELAGFPDGEAHALGVDPVPAHAAMTTPEWIPQWNAYSFTSIATSPELVSGVYRTTLTDGALATQTLVSSIGDASPMGPQIAPDGAWISFTASSSADAPTQVFVIPADGVDPTAWIQVSHVADPLVGSDVLAHLHGSQALVYAVDDTDGPPDGSASLWLVELGELPTIGATMRIDADNDGLRVRRVDVAPDDHALVYWTGQGDTNFGELMLVPLDGLVPQLPIRISTAADAEAFRVDFGWSPDSRWIVYAASSGIDGDWSLDFVDASGALPTAPFAATEPLVDTPELIGFDGASRWFYVVVDAGDGPRIQRIDVSGDEPGAPQLVAAPSAAADRLTGETTWSSSRNELMYTVDVDALDMRQLWVVDVSGDAPSSATRLDTLQGSPGVQFGARLSPDDDIVVFGERSVDGGGPSPLWLVDRSAPGDALPLGDDAHGVVFLPD